MKYKSKIIILILLAILSFVLYNTYENYFPKKENTTIDNNYWLKKPAIYVYSDKNEYVNLKLNLNWKLTYSYPKYDKNWWNFQMNNDKIFLNKVNYDYLFREWEYFWNINYDKTKWFVVKAENVNDFLYEKLDEMWLNQKEINDFIVYWGPILSKNKYNYVYFLNNDFSKIANISTTPNYDSILRVYMLYKKVDKLENIEPQKFEKFQRKWLTIVEWGGSEVK